MEGPVMGYDVGLMGSRVEWDISLQREQSLPFLPGTSGSHVRH